MQYEDFDVSIEAAAGGGRSYRVAVLHSPAGEAQETVDFPFDTLALKLHLAQLENALLKSSGGRRRPLTDSEREVMAFGQALFDFLMHGEIGRRYAVSYDRCRQAGKGLRLKLRIQDPALAALPWEFLYDQRFDHYLALSQYTPLLRYLELPRALRPLAVTPPLRILGMVANPANLPLLDVAVEKQRIEQALASLRAEGLVELTWLSGQGWRDLQRAMRRERWHIFHFIGHGGFDRLQNEGYLLFADSAGQAERMTAASLGRLLDGHASLRVALLNSCEGGQSGDDVFSSTAAVLVRSGIPCVVAMQYAITDDAAVEFARTFYEALADGLSTETAVSDARKSITFSRHNSLEWGTPVVFTHAPDGVLFDLADAPAPFTPQAKPGAQQTTTVTERHKPSAKGSSGIPADLYNQLRSVLLDCGPFATDRELKVVFVDERLAPWQNRLPQADSQAERVMYAIDFLYRQHNDAGENALALLLRALSERVDPRDACRQRLEEMVDQLEQATNSRRSAGLKSAPPAPAPNLAAPRLAAPAANIAIPYIVTGAPPLEMVWCWIPGGKFTMGSNQFDDEKPIHDVPVDGFWLARYLVTNAQYRLFIEADGYKEQRWWSKEGWQQRQQGKWTEPRFWTEKKWNGAQQPVVGVSWYEAAAFCAWAAEATGESIHLPTEAEWEKGARGMDSRAFPWGKTEPNEELCNFAGKVGQTTPVGQYSPQGDSPYGSADIAGNVWEWCRSRYAPYPYNSDDGRNDENGTDVRMARGGSWYVVRNGVRCAYRFRDAPRDRDVNVGFRCASTAF